MLTSFGLALHFEDPELHYSEIVQKLFENNLFLISAILIWFLTCSYINLYQSNRFLKIDWLAIIKVTSIGVAYIVVAADLLNTHINTPKFIILFWLLTLLGMVVTRLILYKGLAITRLKDRNIRHIIIVGMGERGQSIASLLKEHPEVGYRVIGFIDDISKIKKYDINVEGIKLLGGLDSFPGIISETSVDEVFICLPIKSSYDQINTLVNQCKEQGIPARLSSDFFQLEEVKIKIGFLGHAPIITLYNGIEENLTNSIKRFFDITISGVLLVLLSPLFVFVAVLIKITDPGPIFFTQKRIGLHKREFNLYKFRTMVVNAEKLQEQLEAQNEVSGPVFKISNDPRMIRIGGFLRRYSIDELPQLLNVFKGEMSLVGPRPLPIRDFKKFEEHWTRRRFSVRPGITCIWQTSGRSNLSFKQWMELDLKYIDNWSLKLDFLILLKTIPAIIKGTGAY